MLISKKKLKIAFQGMAEHILTWPVKNVFQMQKQFCISFENMLETTKSKVSDLAMVPIENSVAGRVADIQSYTRKWTSYNWRTLSKSKSPTFGLKRCNPQNN